MKLTVDIVQGYLTHSQDAEVRGISTITWDGNSEFLTLDPTSMPAVDFFQDGGGSILVDILSYDQAAPLNLTMIVYDASDPSGNKYSVALKSLTSPFSGVLEYVYAQGQSEFTVAGPNGAADFSQVGAIQLIIDGSEVPAADLAFAGIQTDGLCNFFPDQEGRVIDECGVCQGDNSSCAGCDGVPNSGLVYDVCEVCGGNGQSCLGCDGVPFSGKVLDLCGVCGGNNSGCQGCDGIVNSGKVLDSCGVCDGDGQSCVSCEDVNIFETQVSLDATAKAQEFIVRAALKLLGKIGSNIGKDFTSYIAKNKAAAHTLQIDNWELSWSLPTVINSCSGNPVCITTSNEATLSVYTSQATEIYNIARKAIKKARKLDSGYYSKKLNEYAKGAKDRYDEAISLVGVVPVLNFQCG